MWVINTLSETLAYLSGKIGSMSVGSCINNIGYAFKFSRQNVAWNLMSFLIQSLFPLYILLCPRHIHGGECMMCPHVIPGMSRDHVPDQAAEKVVSCEQGQCTDDMWDRAPLLNPWPWSLSLFSLSNWYSSHLHSSSSFPINLEIFSWKTISLMSNSKIYRVINKEGHKVNAYYTAKKCIFGPT